MSAKAYIPVELRKRVAAQARYRCGYCLRSEELMGMRMAFDHILPEAAGGLTVEENLWLACRACNEFKGKQTHHLDSSWQDGKMMKVLNPLCMRSKERHPATLR